MSKKSRTPRVREQDTQRQRNKRARDAAQAKRLQEEKLKLTTHLGTRDRLEAMRQQGGYKSLDEVVSLTTSYMARLAQRDPAAWREAMDPRNFA